MSSPQAERLASFSEVTGAPDLAEAMLEATGWNLETAISLYFDGHRPSAATAEPSAPAANGQPVSLMEELNRDLVDAEHTLPRVYPGVSTFVFTPGSVLALLLFPFKLGKRGVMTLFSWIFPSLFRWLRPHDSQAIDAPDFPHRFAKRYSNEEIPWYSGTYTQAVDAARRDLKHLVILLFTDGLNQNEKTYVNDFLLEPEMLNFLKREDVIVWGGSVLQSEPYQIALALKASSYPFLALAAPSPKTAQSSTIVMATLFRYGGLADKLTLLRRLEEQVHNHSPKLMALSLSRSRNESDRAMREEQDSAYERSLAADREREAQRIAAEDRIARSKRQLAGYKQRKAKELAVEPKEGARIAMRFPSGQRIVRTFSSTQCIRDIYDFVLLTLEPVNEEEESEESVSFVPEEYPFELMSPALRRPVAPSAHEVREEEAVWPNGSLVVEMI